MLERVEIGYLLVILSHLSLMREYSEEEVLYLSLYI
jgi:hypothetical protein